MAVRGTRVLSGLVAGGVLTGSLLLGAGSALAQTDPGPSPTPSGSSSGASTSSNSGAYGSAPYGSSPSYQQTSPSASSAYGSSPYASSPAPSRYGTAPASPYGTAAPMTGNTVPAECGQSVTAMPGDKVLVSPVVGLPFSQTASPGMAPITKTLGGALCQVDVTVLRPASGTLIAAAPAPLKPITSALSGGASSAIHPASPVQAMPPAMGPMAMPMMPPSQTMPSASAFPAMTPQQLSASAPMFAPAFTALPANFLADAMMPAGVTPGIKMDPAMLLGSALPGLRAGAPAYLGYDPASAVTTASQVQALPVDGLSSAGGGIGLPIMIAVLVLAGVAAFAVRRSVIGPRVATAGAGAAVTTPATGSDAATPAAATPAAEPAAATTTVVGDSAAERTMVTGGPALGAAGA